MTALQLRLALCAALLATALSWPSVRTAYQQPPRYAQRPLPSAATTKPNPTRIPRPTSGGHYPPRPTSTPSPYRTNASSQQANPSKRAPCPMSGGGSYNRPTATPASTYKPTKTRPPASRRQPSSQRGASSPSRYSPQTAPPYTGSSQGGAPAPARAPAPAPAPAPLRAPAAAPAAAPRPMPLVRPTPSATPTQSSSPTPSPSPSPRPRLPGSSIQLGKANASATGNTTLSVGAEKDRAAAAGNSQGAPIALGAAPGQAAGVIGLLRSTPSL